jgi:adenosylcobinamide-GDP ribazoletransferase
MTDHRVPDPDAQASPAAPPPSPTGWKRAAVETAQCLRFYSRLSVPKLSFEADAHAPPDFATVPRMLPVAGGIIGAIGAAVVLIGAWLGLPALLAAALATTILVFATGAFGEDGLADAFDGLFGGHTPERRLEIMSDSRVGSYGVCAVVLVLVLRVAALAALIESAGAASAAAGLIAACAVSRVAGLVPLWVLTPAKRDGRSAAVGRPTDATMRTAATLAGGTALLLIGPAFSLFHVLLALAAATLAAFAFVRLAKRLLGGQTGDIAGAIQQVAEAAILMALCALPGWRG